MRTAKRFYSISVKVVADSINSRGNRLTTLELEFPAYVLDEFMSHRMFSRTYTPMRAIPTATMISNVFEKPAVPVYWGKNRKGMQATEEHFELVEIPGTDPVQKTSPRKVWLDARSSAATYASNFKDAGYHKQITNGLLQPFLTMKVLCTATEYENFFWLRRHAQPETKELADMMCWGMQDSDPRYLSPGEWHLPYISDETISQILKREKATHISQEDLRKISVSCCAQVSYRTLDYDLEKAIRIYDKLIGSFPYHSSPFEHQATPMPEELWEIPPTNINTEIGDFHPFRKSGITHFTPNKQKFIPWSGNFQGWFQYRQKLGV